MTINALKECSDAGWGRFLRLIKLFLIPLIKETASSSVSDLKGTKMNEQVIEDRQTYKAMTAPVGVLIREFFKKYLIPILICSKSI